MVRNDQVQYLYRKKERQVLEVLGLIPAQNEKFWAESRPQDLDILIDRDAVN